MRVAHRRAAQTKTTTPLPIRCRWLTPTISSRSMFLKMLRQRLSTVLVEPTVLSWLQRKKVNRELPKLNSRLTSVFRRSRKSWRASMLTSMPTSWTKLRSTTLCTTTLRMLTCLTEATGTIVVTRRTTLYLSRVRMSLHPKISWIRVGTRTSMETVSGSKVLTGWTKSCKTPLPKSTTSAYRVVTTNRTMLSLVTIPTKPVLYATRVTTV